jgi:rhodanese-related sulfurtransferase
MLKKIVLGCFILISSVMADFRTLSTKEVETSIKNGVAIIDIRRADEHEKYGTIRGSHKLTFFDKAGNVNIEKWMTEFTKIVKDKEQPFILVCAHANRTKVVGKFLSEQAGFKNVQELEGGINYGWIDKGKKTVK